ncbi:MAG: pilus assembly protein CpaE [Acidobacteria bacterium]|nr:pilus assembly protein CpaE [Acidobacteriota bacterium]
MISRPLALRLRQAGLVWRPAAGDRFQFLAQDMESTGAEAFTVSDMTIEAHAYPTGTVLGFNGTTEWALDSIAIEEALWFPREDQLREALKGTFETLERDLSGDGWRVTCTFRGERRTHLADTAEDAYALAVLAEVEASSV